MRRPNSLFTEQFLFRHANRRTNSMSLILLGISLVFAFQATLCARWAMVNYFKCWSHPEFNATAILCATVVVLSWIYLSFR